MKYKVQYLTPNDVLETKEYEADSFQVNNHGDLIIMKKDTTITTRNVVNLVAAFSARCWDRVELIPGVPGEEGGAGASLPKSESTAVGTA